MSLRADLKPALTGTWLVISFVLAIAATVPFLLPADTIYGIIPQCEAKRRGGSCALCGMTTAFVLIARGDLNGAQTANGGSLPVWCAFVLNFAVAATYSLMALVNRRRYSGGQRTCNYLP